MPQSRIVQDVAVFAAGDLPFAVLWSSPGRFRPFFLGTVAAIVVTVVLRKEGPGHSSSR